MTEAAPEEEDVGLVIFEDQGHHCRDQHARYSHYNNSESSNDNENRQEVPWAEKNQNLLKIWKQQIHKNSISHKKKAKCHKILYFIFATPPVIIPVTLGLLRPQLGPEYELLMTLFLVGSTICSGLSSLFNFGKQEEGHRSVHNSYSDLYEEINYILTLSKADRAAADVTMTRIRMRMSHLDEIAPGG